MILHYREFEMRGQQIGIKFGSTQVQAKSFKILRKFGHGKTIKFPVCYRLPPHKNLVLEIKLVPGVMGVFSPICLLL
jgi:hypothetical protein